MFAKLKFGKIIEGQWNVKIHLRFEISLFLHPKVKFPEIKDQRYGYLSLFLDPFMFASLSLERL